jgi:hypothetical protein
MGAASARRGRLKHPRIDVYALQTRRMLTPQVHFTQPIPRRASPSWSIGGVRFGQRTRGQALLDIQREGALLHSFPVIPCRLLVAVSRKLKLELNSLTMNC